jgi:hypothetical protein
MGGGCGYWAWSDNIYQGPLTNQAPTVSQFSLSPASLPRGALVTITAGLTDPDANLTSMTIDHLPPTSSTWVNGQTAEGTAWSGTARGSQSLSKVMLLSTAGRWDFRASGADALAANSGPTFGFVVVRDTPYYDPTNYHNGLSPTVEILSGDGLFGVVDTFGPGGIVFRVKNSLGQPLAGAPVQLIVAQGGGGLATSPSGSGALILNLTTNSAGEVQVHYRRPNVAHVTSLIDAISGMGTTTARSHSYSAADAAQDPDQDGLTTSLENTLGSQTGTAAIQSPDPKLVVF